MTTLIAKMKREQNRYKLILNQEDIIVKDVDLGSFVCNEYKPNLLRDENEWFILKDFSQTKYYLEVLAKNYSTANYTSIDKNDFDYTRIKFICIIQENLIYFQKITPSLFVNKKTFLSFDNFWGNSDGQPTIVHQNKQIEIRKGHDAIYDRNYDILYFKNISTIKSIFPHIEELHREATKEEITKFINSDFISLIEFKVENVGVPNRKRIADIGLKFDILDADKRKKLLDYVKKQKGIKEVNGQIEINTDKDLQMLLYALDQRFYRSEVYEEDRIANSYIKITT